MSAVRNRYQATGSKDATVDAGITVLSRAVSKSTINPWQHYYTSVHSHFFTSRCLVAVSNGGLSPTSVFPNGPRPQLPASHSNSSQRLNQSSSISLANSRPNSLNPNWSCLQDLVTDRVEDLYSIIEVQLLPWKHAWLRSRYIATAVA
jgi:hypothetical protein